jgi:hypothetical protein
MSPPAVNSQAQSAAGAAKTESTTAPANDLSPEKRKLALTMLRTGEAEARSLPPDLRCYALAQVARGYARIDSPRTKPVLVDAFASSYGLDPHNSKTKLQRDILSQLFPLDEAKVMELLPGAETSVREEIMLKLVRRDIHAGKLDEAVTLLEQISSWTEFPYREGTDVMQAFPKDESWQRGVVFSRAFASFAARRYNENNQWEPNDQFAQMIVSNWHDLPAGTVEQAIDEVLKQAKASTKHRYTNFNASDGQSINFDSVYHLRLFELLPILQQLNKPKAERILQDELLMGGLLSKYPKGPDSLFPESDSAGVKKAAYAGTPGSMSTFPAPSLGGYDKLKAETKRIAASAAEDPAQALAQAQTLPLETKIIEAREPIRMEALRAIAIASFKSKPATAREAIADMINTAIELTEPSDQVFQLVEAARLSLELGDIDRAKSALESATGKANDAVKKDEDRDDPNQALKAYWPSAVAWQGLLHVATRVSPVYAQKLTHEIWDDQIRVLATIALADELAGVPPGHHTTMQRLAHRGHYSDGAKVYADDDDPSR